jgi:hypothetical protein
MAKSFSNEFLYAWAGAIFLYSTEFKHRPDIPAYTTPPRLFFPTPPPRPSPAGTSVPSPSSAGTNRTYRRYVVLG